MRKTLGLAALVAASAGVLVPASSASASPQCDVIAIVAGTYETLDRRLGDRLPDLTWTCTA